MTLEKPILDANENFLEFNPSLIIVNPMFLKLT